MNYYENKESDEKLNVSSV